MIQNISILLSVVSGPFGNNNIQSSQDGVFSIYQNPEFKSDIQNS